MSKVNQLDENLETFRKNFPLFRAYLFEKHLIYSCNDVNKCIDWANHFIKKHGLNLVAEKAFNSPTCRDFIVKGI